MKIKCSKYSEYSDWDCYPETEKEVDILKEICPEDYDPKDPWKVGDGPFCFGLKGLHELVQKGVTLNGLPDWLIIK